FESKRKEESAAVQEKRKVASALGIPNEAVELLEQLPKAARKEALDLFLNELRRRKYNTQDVDTHPANFADQLAKSLNQPARHNDSESAPDDTPVGDPARRRQRTDEEIGASHENELPLSERSRLAARKIWESKNPEARAFLKKQYDGRCQICSDTFCKRDGE